MNAQQLKNSILQMAVSGKLVPQDPNDEPASVLLERIRKEKEKLIKEGKIKKEKNPSYIFRGADNTPYEKVGSAEPVSIADEVPFEIPESWVWARIGSIFNLQAGKNITSSSISDTEYPGSFPCFGGNGIRGYVDHFNREGSYPLIGRQGALCGNINFAHGKFYATEHAVVVESFGGTDSTWAGLFLEAINLNQYATATAQPGLAVSNINRLLIPIPPIPEQKRIVLRYSELIPCVLQYEQSEKRLVTLNTKFPEELKKSILQMAVQGKLVPQNPSDEPASILLDRIRGEKERLVAEGKIKRDKNESVIFRRDNSHYEKLGSMEQCIDSEIPFDIPESWSWTRLSSLGAIVGGGTPKTTNPLCWDGDIPWLTPADMKYVNGMYVDKGERCITDYGLQNSSAQMMPSGTILYSSRAPIGYIAIAANDICTNQGFKSLIPAIDHINQYLYYCLIERTPEIQSRASGTTFKEISGTEFGRTLIPLPPLGEQDRIVKQIESILPIVKSL